MLWMYAPPPPLEQDALRGIKVLDVVKYRTIAPKESVLKVFLVVAECINIFLEYI